MVKKGDKLKIQVVKSYLNGEGSQSAIAKKYKLRSRTQLMNWVRKYQKTGDISDLRGQNGCNNGLKKNVFIPCRVCRIPE
ncbi:transposase [Bacillus nitratireducens]|uniref:Insertion element IS150 protein InsJ-like helix-turn-helix domain-containing protein n=2 Tax=Bacillus TaxID=1386 RepID=A0AA44R6M5_9BACI|nr:helix-turn-helix domain-containing protein [Bacillus nitratireducens]OJD44471.1 hypothetical protein BAU23_19125 [Bacillus nitratireducens]OJE41971.1 hypothetical protein BAQ49_12080 [Bacillus proteolyticus]